MPQRIQAPLLLAFAALIALLLLVTPLRAADPTAIACPSGQVATVVGRASAGAALLIYFNGRPVGGGVADSSGVYRLPLQVQERPGTYPAEVRLRSDLSLVERFTCFVDLPLDSTPTPSPSAAPTRAGSPAAPATPRAVSPTPATSPSPGRSPTSGVVVTATNTRTATATVTGTPPTATATVTGTPPTATTTRTTGTPTTTTTAVVDANIRIIDVAVFDPAQPDAGEFVQLQNFSANRPVRIGGWQLRNLSLPDGTRPAIPPFVFPDYTFQEGQIAVYSGPGTNDFIDGNFYWGQAPSIWKAGDRAELRDAAGNLIHTFTVPAS